MTDCRQDNKKLVYRRADKIWPWGYYIPPRVGLQPGQYGHFLAQTKQEAIKQVNRIRK